MIFDFESLGGLGGFQDKFLSDLTHLIDDFVQGPVVGNGKLHFMSFLLRVVRYTIRQSVFRTQTVF